MATRRVNNNSRSFANLNFQANSNIHNTFQVEINKYKLSTTFSKRTNIIVVLNVGERVLDKRRRDSFFTFFPVFIA